MKKIDLGQSIGLLANIGVIAGIIFLVVELQNNTRATEAQTRNSITENYTAWTNILASNEFAVQVWVKGNNQYDQLTPTEGAAYNNLLKTVFRNFENEWYQYQLGLFSEEEFKPRLDLMEWSMYGCGVRSAWDDGRFYSASFREFLNNIIEDSECVVTSD